MLLCFFVSSRRRHTRCALVTGVQTCALPIYDGGAARLWALAGMGILVRSEWDVADLLRQGRLVELLPGWRLPDADIVALVASRTARSARTERSEERRVGKEWVSTCRSRWGA